MFNIRYHIASLVGVFLALALGLILGGLVVQSGAVDQQQSALVDGLRDEFASLREENRVLATEKETLDSFGGAMTDAWVAGRLQGATVLVLTNAGRETGVSAASEAIESAGGRVALAVFLKPGLGLEDADVRSQVASPTASAEEVQGSVVASLAAEWATPAADRPLTRALIDAGVLRLEGLERTVVATGLVDVATSDGEPDDVAVRLAAAFSQFGSALGAQTITEDTGVAVAADAAGIAALDTLGSMVGRYSLVALLSGAKPDYYGVADQAVAAYPPVPR